ncbi:hypothetical protein BU25DRAFT_419305 [Macroventuria anomochaeta]|uniref:Uncharacterized protein n=1 Tax=Macroventuria anomochaeta TaxID=301207 RepID=A0ACB6S8A4_9PLEO|nr:uncharacterized protein BU25DRAFT_419305 [Macroventuria anomochaeta]KAF2630289.1 hypothetical protein BU25DRAFT_419305 [Macroventuria anomochaeta]
MQPLRYFSSTAACFIKYIGYDPASLPGTWLGSFEKCIEPGGGAEKKGTDSPVHHSHFNREDIGSIIATRIVGPRATKICHIYKNGTGTEKKGNEGVKASSHCGYGDYPKVVEERIDDHTQLEGIHRYD